MNDSRSRQWLQFSLLLAISHQTVAFAAATASLCDAQVIDRSGSTYGYRFRGDRCEGTYQEPTAATSQDLTVISFACAGNAVALGPSAKPTVAWASADGSLVSIRVETLPEIRLRYRLDAASTDPAARFSWDGDTWRAFSIDPTQLVALIKGGPKLGGVEMPGTLLLARIGADAALSDCSKGPTVAVRSGHRISTLKLCAAPLADSGLVVGTPVCKTVSGTFMPNSSIFINPGVLASPTRMLQLSLEGDPSATLPAHPRYYRIRID